MTHSDGDSWHLIQPVSIGGETPLQLSTGDPDDDQLLRQIAARDRLDRPREVKHFLYVPDEDSAQMVARPLAMTGWQAEIFAPEDTGEPYLVTVARDGVVLTADLVRSSRELFEQIVSVVPGTEYDGWEASIGTDTDESPTPDS
jgi:hypothetical protein